MNVNEHGGYKIGTKVGQIKGYMCRNQVQFVTNRRKITPRKCPLTRINARRCHGDSSFINTA
jgi:hypothetical protein